MMGEACCCNYDNDGEGPDVISERIVTARKEHHCCECGEAIRPGSSASRQ